MRVVYTGGEGEITEKKSHFIATVKPVQSEEEAVAFINETKKKYWPAAVHQQRRFSGDAGSVRLLYPPYVPPAGRKCPVRQPDDR